MLRFLRCSRTASSLPVGRTLLPQSPSCGPSAREVWEERLPVQTEAKKLLRTSAFSSFIGEGTPDPRHASRCMPGPLGVPFCDPQTPECDFGCPPVQSACTPRAPSSFAISCQHSESLGSPPRALPCRSFPSGSTRSPSIAPEPDILTVGTRRSPQEASGKLLFPCGLRPRASGSTSARRTETETLNVLKVLALTRLQRS